MNGRPLSNNNKMVDIFWVKSNFPPLRNSKLKLAARERMRDHEISWNPSADLKMNDLNVQRELFSGEMVVSKGSREAEKVAVVEGSDRCRHIALGVRGADVRRCRRPASRCWHKRWPTTITHARWRARIVQSRKMLGVRYTRKKIESGPTYFSFGARPSAPAASQSPRCLNWDISSFSNSVPLLSSLSGRMYRYI